MDVNNVTNVNVNVNVYSNQSSQGNVTVENNVVIINDNENSNEAAVYEKSKPEKFTPDANKIKNMLAETNRATEMLRQLVEKLLSKQGLTANQAFGILSGAAGIEFEVDEETQLKAQEAISEDGYYGVKQTSERILDFAKALSGGDPSKIDLLKDAFIKGFEEAERVWGGKLPEISYETYDAVMKGFEEWANEAGTSNVLAQE